MAQKSAAAAGFHKAVAKHQRRGEREQARDGDDDEQPRQSERQAGLQNQPIERDQAEPVIAAAGQPAFAPQLDQHALAIGAVLGDQRSRRLIRLR